MNIYSNKNVIAIGNFLFKYRNFLFPLTIVCMFVIALPQNTFFGSVEAKIYKDYIAIMLCCLGLLIRAIVIGFAYIKRGGVNKKVYADNLVTTGIFALCRNPLYDGNVLIYTGIFLLHGNLFVFIAGVLLFIFIYICIISAEENYLKNKFGVEFDEYCARTPRWIPALSRYKEATNGMYFDFQKVMLKDYTTIFNTFVAIILIEMFEQVYYTNDSATAVGLGFLVVLMFVAMVMIRKYKKSNAIKVTDVDPAESAQ